VTEPTVLSRRELNRALLARQQLLAPAQRPVVEMVEHLVGMQAQEPQAPYIGLWNRLRPFDPEDLSSLIDEGQAVRGSLMRSTVHLVTAGDYQLLWPLMRTVLARHFQGSQFRKAIAGASTEAVLGAGRALIDEWPRTRAELREQLGARWPGIDPTSLAYAVSYLTPLVQVPPRGLWRASGQARLATADTWLGAQLADEPADHACELVIARYLAAFGPAAVKDIQAWCGMTRLSSVVDRMRPRLRTFRDELGRELFDVADGPLPPADTPAAPRLLAPFDNVILGHDDRTRIIADEHRARLSRDRLMRAFLVDGFVAGTWRFDRDAVALEPFGRLRRSDRAALDEEAQRLREFIA
jgi:hypothetical protein